jgi:hypothetical protein
MNRIDRSQDFSADAIRAHKDDQPHDSRGGKLNPTATQIAGQFTRDTISPVMVSGAMRLVEFALLAVSGILVGLWYVEAPEALSWRYLLAIFSGAALAVILLELRDAYQIAFLRRPGANLGRLVLIWAGALAIVALIGFFLKMSEDFSRVWFAGWLVAGTVSLVALRAVMARLIARWARNGTMERRAVIVGGVLVGTFFTLFVIPAVYTYLTWRERPGEPKLELATGPDRVLEAAE